MEDRIRRCRQPRVTLANLEDTLRGRAGPSVIIYVVFHLFEKNCLFRSSYTISSIMVASESRGTENGIPPESSLC